MQLSPIQLIAPHYCSSCGAIGELLCEYCKYNIVSEPFEACILCHKLARPAQNLCSSCVACFTKAWCVGARNEGLKALVNQFKFDRVRGAYQPLAELLHATLPEFPSDTIVVAIPTIAPHIRIRGYDQTALVARSFAKLRNLSYESILRRATNTVQQGAGRKLRQEQAKLAFAARPCTGRVLLIDDISTTGSTIKSAAERLIEAGASEVWVAVLASQPLENQ